MDLSAFGTGAGVLGAYVRDPQYVVDRETVFALPKLESLQRALRLGRRHERVRHSTMQCPRRASVLEVKSDFHESLKVLGVHGDTCAEDAEGVQSRSARRGASARASLGCLPRSRRRL